MIGTPLPSAGVDDGRVAIAAGPFSRWPVDSMAETGTVETAPDETGAAETGDQTPRQTTPPFGKLRP